MPNLPYSHAVTRLDHDGVPSTSTIYQPTDLCPIDRPGCSSKIFAYVWRSGLIQLLDQVYFTLIVSIKIRFDTALLRHDHLLQAPALSWGHRLDCLGGAI